MAPLSLKGAETKYRIIRAAAELFHKQGLHATSPDEIIEASETGKGQFYHYFKSKEGLVHEVLLWHLDAIRNGTSPIKYEITSWRDLETWFHSHIEFQKNFGMTRGCPFGTAANEVTEGEELIRQDLSLIFEVTRLRRFSSEKRRNNGLLPTLTSKAWLTFALPRYRAPCSSVRSGGIAIVPKR